MGKKKSAGYVVYARHHQKKYETLARKRLSVPELVTYANQDWKNEPDEVKDHFKAIAKGETSVSSVHETSSQRLDTEAPVVTDMSIGEQLNQRMKAQVKKVSGRYKTSIETATVDDIMDREIGVVDFNVYIDYLDGLSVPAEFAIVRGTVRDGIMENSVYSELIHIDPLNTSHLRLGFRNEVKVNCERVHGIDVYSKTGLALTLEEFCGEVGDKIPPTTLLLCRSEDERSVLGSWYWLKQKGTLLPKIELMTIEDFLVKTTDCLIQLGRRDTNGASFSQFTELLSKPTYDTEASLRCDYHNSDAACDKPSCTKKNTRKYFFLLVRWLAGFLPELNLENGKHYYQSPRIERRGKQPAVPSNSRAEPPHVEWDYPERQESVPRRPAEVVFSARGECSKGSNRSSPVAPVQTEPDTSVPPQLPRRPKLDPTKPEAKSSNSFQKSAYTYDTDSIATGGWNGAKAVDLTPAPQTGDTLVPTNNSVQSSHQPGSLGGIGRGRRRRGSSSPPGSLPPGNQTAPAPPGNQTVPAPPGNQTAPAPPGYQTAPPGNQTAPPGYTFLPLPGISDANCNGASFGRGQRFAAVQVTQVTESRAPFVSDVENGMDSRD